MVKTDGWRTAGALSALLVLSLLHCARAEGPAPASSAAAAPGDRPAASAPDDRPGATAEAPPPPPRDVQQCSSAVERTVSGHPTFNRFVWDRKDPRKTIQSTLMPSTEFRGKLVPVDYTLILVGQLRQRGSGQLVDGNGVCGMRGGRIISVRVAPSPSHG